MNSALNKHKNSNPIQDKIFIGWLYWCSFLTKLLFRVSIDIHPNKGAVKKLQVIAPKTKSLMLISPNSAKRRAMIAAKTCNTIQTCKFCCSDLALSIFYLAINLIFFFISFFQKLLSYEPPNKSFLTLS